MRKSVVTIISIALLTSSVYAAGKYGFDRGQSNKVVFNKYSVDNDDYDSYDEGWDDGYDPGAKEGRDDICIGKPYYINEDFSDESDYDIGWAKGYKYGYAATYKKGCDVHQYGHGNGKHGYGRGHGKHGHGNRNGHRYGQGNGKHGYGKNHRGENSHGKGGHGEGHTDFNLDTLPKTSTLTQKIKESLAYMGNEERLAYDIYTTLYNYHQDNSDIEIRQFLNIKKAEQRHIEIVKDLVKRYNIDVDTLQNVSDPVADMDIAFEDMPVGSYDIEAIQDLYDALYKKGIKSKQAALEVGCMVEVVDVDDLDRYIQQAEESDASDVVEAFEVLRAGSYNHYWAFDRGLKNMGISEGCAVLGEEYEKTPQEYPSSNRH